MCHVGEESRLSTEEEEEEKDALQGARVASGSQQDIPSVGCWGFRADHWVVETKKEIVEER